MQEPAAHERKAPWDFARWAFLGCVLMGCQLAGCADETKIGDTADSDPSGQPTSPDRLQRPPNLVVVVLDTLRADHLGLYGYPLSTSPHLDARSGEFFVFENAQSVAPWTCPSLISLMTSLYPSVHQVRSFPRPERLSDEIPTLAELLHQQGYRTAAFTEGGYAKAMFGLGQGFEEYPENPGDASSNTSNLQHPSRLRDNMTRTLDWIEEHRDEPFFAFFHTYEPHAPFRAPEEELKDFRPGFDEAAEHDRLGRAIERWNRDGEMSSDDELLLEIHRFHCSLLGLPEIERKGLSAERRQCIEERREELVQALTELYDAEIHTTDRELERLFEALEDWHLAENTVVVIVSDHGEGLGEHGRFGHGKVLHEEVLRVPLMIRAPGVSRPPRRIPGVVSTVDVMPTVLELLGNPSDRSRFQGRSLLPEMSGEGSERPVFSHALGLSRDRNQLYAVRNDRWRLVMSRDAQLCQLYDHAADPRELHDVADEHPETVAALQELLLRQHEEDVELLQILDATPGDARMDSDLLDELRRLGYLEDQPPRESR